MQRRDKYVPDDEDVPFPSRRGLTEGDAIVTDIMEPIVRGLRERQAALEARLDAHERGMRMLRDALTLMASDDEVVRAHAKEHGRVTLTDPNYYRLGHLEATVLMALVAMEAERSPWSW